MTSPESVGAKRPFTGEAVPPTLVQAVEDDHELGKSGSAHHQPRTPFRIRPSRTAPSGCASISVTLPSVCSTGLSSAMHVRALPKACASIATHMIPHFAAHADDVHGGAASEADEQQLRRTWTGIGAACFRSRVHDHLLAVSVIARNAVSPRTSTVTACAGHEVFTAYSGG